MHYENLVCVFDYIYVETRDTLLLVGHLYDQHNLWILVLPYQPINIKGQARQQFWGVKRTSERMLCSKWTQDYRHIPISRARPKRRHKNICGQKIYLYVDIM